MRAAAPRRQSISGPTGALETVIEDSGIESNRFGVVCHPHPLFGGTMDNKVVTTVARALQDCGIPTLRFNFRGVGASGGVFDAGIGETRDADAVASWGALQWPGRQLVIAGFSFGAFVALRLAQQRPASHLITIAPPVGRFDFSGLQPPPCPWLVVQGEADDVVDPGSVFTWAAGLHPAPRLLAVPGVGHFFHGRLQELRDAVSDAVRSS